jgi:hypothetical protein
MKWHGYELTSSDNRIDALCHESDGIYLHRNFLEDIMYYADGMERIYVKLVNPLNDKHVLCSVGGCHHIPKNENLIGVPRWISEELQVIDGLGYIEVQLYTNIIFKGDEISIRPLDPIIYNMDTLDILQRGMDKYTVLQEGTTIDIVISELDNYPIKIIIEKLHMARDYMLLGGELELHLVGREEVVESEKECIPDISTKDNTVEHVISDMPFGIDVPSQNQAWVGIGRILKENESQNEEAAILNKDYIRQKRLARFTT